MRRVSLLITSIVCSITVICPLLGRGDGKYFTVLYAAILLWAAGRPFPSLRAAPTVYLFILANILVAVFHLDDARTFVNAGAVVVSVIALVAVAYHCIRRYGSEAVYLALEKALWISLIISFVLSVGLTEMGAAVAPRYFPWEAFFSKARLLLISGQDVGHTPSLWLFAFASAFTLHRVMQAKRLLWGLLALLVLLGILLLATKSRLALVYIVNLFVMGLAYKRVAFTRALVIILPVMFCTWFLVYTLMPSTTENVTNLATDIQKTVGEDIRIVPKKGSGATILAGRGVLNRALFKASMHEPVIGLGSNADILLYGVDSEGNIAYDKARRVAGTESALRLAVKFGWPYLASVAVFLLTVPLYMNKFGRAGWILKAGLWGMCIESIVLEGGMEVYYGVSALFLFILCLIVFESMLARADERESASLRRSQMEVAHRTGAI